MKNKNRHNILICLISVLFLLTLCSCSSTLDKAYKAFENQEYSEALILFNEIIAAGGNEEEIAAAKKGVLDTYIAMGEADGAIKTANTYFPSDLKIYQDILRADISYHSSDYLFQFPKEIREQIMPEITVSIEKQEPSNIMMLKIEMERKFPDQCLYYTIIHPDNTIETGTCYGDKYIYLYENGTYDIDCHFSDYEHYLFYSAKNAEHFENMGIDTSKYYFAETFTVNTEPTPFTEQISNPLFERMITEYFDKPLSEITEQDMLSVKSLAIVGNMAVQSHSTGDAIIDYKTGKYSYRYFDVELNDFVQVIEEREGDFGNNFSDLKYFKNLKSLSIILNPSMDDISFISDLKNLESLSVAGVTSIDSPLSSKDAFIEYPYLAASFTDISVLRELPCLKTLHLLSSAEITDFTPLSDTHLENVYIVLQEFDPELINPILVKELNLRSCGIKDLTFIKDMVNIRYIGLGYNDIDDISPLLDLEPSNIWGIHLYGNGLTQEDEDQIREHFNIRNDFTFSR